MILNYITNFIFFVFLIFSLFQLAKFNLYLLYLWQFKEYRPDRLKIYFINKSDRAEFFSFFNIMNFIALKHPRLTLRLFFSFLIILLIDYQLLFFSFRPAARILNFTDSFGINLLLIILVIYLISPLLVSLVIILSSLLTFPFKRLIILLAILKIRKFKNLLVIGVTGSYGKSTTKEALFQTLSLKYSVLKTPKNINTEIGIAKLILTKLNKNHQIFVVEIGAYKKGEIKAVCNIVNPKIGILTGINEQHLGIFKNLKNTIEAKSELIKSLPSDGLALFNAANPYTYKLFTKRTKCEKALYGLRSKKYLEALDLCWVIAKKMGIRHAQFDKIIPQLNRLLDIKIYRGYKNVKILDDSYNSNPSGFFKAVGSLDKVNKKRLVITPGIIELGSKSKQIHSALGASLAKIADVIIVTNNNFYDDFKTEVDQKDKEKFWLVTDKVKTKNWLIQNISRNWVILLEGRVPYWVGQNLKKIK